ncbi:hypothetical protein HBI56_031970 [Parastagonospora nodorum]|uniref:Uncharacterized protein n=1 Tax=Phaeosphaeria nodorum (strain SN15 / ATCC MYA-4574 / FGSC 10173) TaxID=321614 RepID=A0A7U2HYJ2_PHANO|nr:hypothetical protein HBH56_019680 [Parastagonospora nodorum]QRC95368.1 hypothetical protein JI435_030620 [Parastagonospora nodorum SN15]KAH3937498.1 hypothetical protein HBH54_014820 [Parastagonospora nodorum]KAH3953499.1 hypothetical protein HBH53_026970 [Parastagonospora nodorum]KAH3962645.1 hypothetical protein HBH51_174830 [Parastagonospora nodorum]
MHNLPYFYSLQDMKCKSLAFFVHHQRTFVHPHIIVSPIACLKPKTRSTKLLLQRNAPSPRQRPAIQTPN